MASVSQNTKVLLGCVVAFFAIGCGDKPLSKRAGESSVFSSPESEAAEGSSARRPKVSLPTPDPSDVKADDIDLEGRKTVENTYEFTMKTKFSNYVYVPVSVPTEFADVVLFEDLQVLEESSQIASLPDTTAQWNLVAKPYKGLIDSITANGESLDSLGITYTYNATTNQIVFANLTAESYLMAVTFKAGKGPILSYNYTDSTNVIGRRVTDAGTGAAVSASFSGNSVTIGSSSFVANKTLAVEFYPSKTTTVSTTLQQAPLPGTLTTDVMGCKESSGVSATGTVVTITCAKSNSTRIKLNYQYSAKLPLKVTYPEAVDAERGEWRVLVDGVEFKEARRVKQDFFFDELLPDRSIVTIVYKKL